MMLGWLFPRQSQRRLLPGGRMRGPTAYVIAIMTFAMIVMTAAGLALANAASMVSAGIAHRYTVQLPGGGSDPAQALDMLRRTPAISNVELVPEQEMRRTLERWLGPAGAGADLPVPTLIHLDLAEGADADVVASAVERRIAGARFIAHSDNLRPLLRAMTALQWIALALVALMAAATAATVVLAARGALDTHRSTIEIMHGIGATDLQVTHLFQRKIALDAIIGAGVGTAVAGLVLLLLGGGAAVAGELAGRAPLGPRDAVILALLPVVIAVLATWVARVAVLAALRRSL
ncbi:MAG TPA: cell division protein [Sphingomicrobium sp.]|nr:cell division protein [Sphingomicrobium sp.]